MSTTTSGDQKRIPLLSMVAAIAAVSVAGMGFGHSIPLFSYVLKDYGASDFIIGSSTAFAAVAALLCTPFYPRLISIFGLRTFLIASVITMVIPYILVYFAGERLILWYPLRFVLAFGAAGLFAGSEIWINGLAPDHIRGRVIGLYATCLSLGFAVGPLILRFTGYEGFLPFLVGAIVFCLAVLPLFAVRTPSIEHEDQNNDIFVPLRQFPVIFGAASMFAAVESAMLIFLPILALELGHSIEVGTQVLTVYGLGLVASQIPVGQLADKFSPRLVVTGCSALAALFALMVPFVQTELWALYAVLFVWGGAIGGIYTAGLVVVGNTFKGEALAAANTGFTFAYAVGGVLGPFAAGVIRDGMGGNGLIGLIAVTLALYACAAARRPTADRA